MCTYLVGHTQDPTQGGNNKHCVVRGSLHRNRVLELRCILYYSSLSTSLQSWQEIRIPVRAECSCDLGKRAVAGLGFPFIGDTLPLRNRGFRFKKDSELAVKSIRSCY